MVVFLVYMIVFLFGIFLQKSTATTRYILNRHHNQEIRTSYLYFNSEFIVAIVIVSSVIVISRAFL